MAIGLESIGIGFFSAILGTIAGPVIKGEYDRSRAKNSQKATDRRTRGQIYSSKKAEALAELAGITPTVKIHADAQLNAIKQMPEETDPDDIGNQFSSFVKDYQIAFGKVGIFVDNSDLLDAAEQFSNEIHNTNKFLHQAASQSTRNPSNSPPHNGEELNDAYLKLKQELREEISEPIQNWETQ